MISYHISFKPKLPHSCEIKGKKRKRGRLYKEVYIYLKRQTVIPKIVLLSMGKNRMQFIMPRMAALLPLHLRPYLCFYLMSSTNNLSRACILSCQKHGYGTFLVMKWPPELLLDRLLLFLIPTSC